MRGRFSHTLLAMPLALALGCAGTVPVMAQEDEPTQLQRMLGSFGLLAIPGDSPEIEYRERPPLVVPPSTDLPLPRNPTDITAAVPDWPADPEIARQREQKRYDQLPIDQRRSEFHTGRALTPAEIRRGTIARARFAHPEHESRRGDHRRPRDAGGPERPLRHVQVRAGEAGRLHRRATAHTLDRAAARLSDALSECALWRGREGQAIHRASQCDGQAAGGRRQDEAVSFLPVHAPRRVVRRFASIRTMNGNATSRRSPRRRF